MMKRSSQTTCWLFVMGLIAVTMLHALLLCLPVVICMPWHGLVPHAAVVLFLLLISVWCLIESVQSSNNMRFPMQSYGPSCLPYLVGMSLLSAFWVSLADIFVFAITPSNVLIIVGSLLMAVGILLRYLSLRTLGEFFLNEITMLPGQPLVTHGIYGAVRHPSETGILCLAIGGAVMLGSICGFLIVALLLSPFLVWRVKLEDRMLRSHYPCEFEHYQKLVPAFFPSLRFISRCLYDTRVIR